MKKPILFDLDGVLADSQSRMLLEAYRRTRIKFAYGDWTTFGYLHNLVAKVLNVDYAKAAEWLNSSAVVNSAQPILGAPAIIKYLCTKGYLPVVATGRPIIQRKDTLLWLANNIPQIEPNDVHLLPLGGNTHDFKYHVAISTKAVCVIEDSVEQLLYLASKPEMERVLLVLVDRPWNSNVNFPVGEYRIRIGNWRWFEQGWFKLVRALDKI